MLPYVGVHAYSHTKRGMEMIVLYDVDNVCGYLVLTELVPTSILKPSSLTDTELTEPSCSDYVC